MLTFMYPFMLYVPFLPLYYALTFSSLPSNVTLSGSYLKLSCSSKNQIFPILWSHNDKEIAENCRFYMENHRYVCNRLNDVYEIFIPNVKFEDRGNWSCAHGPKSQKTINIDVLVKANVYPPKLLALPSNVKVLSIDQNPTIINKVDNTRLQEKSMIGHIYGLGTLNNPIDLINKKAYTENGIFIECTTSCATSVKGIHWKAKNSTWTHSLHVHSGISNNDDGYIDDSLYNQIHRFSHNPEYTNPVCELGLKSVKSRIQIKCASSKSQVSSLSTSNHLLSHTLVGLNKITCFPYYDKEMESKLSKLTQLNDEHKGGSSQFVLQSKIMIPTDVTQNDCFIDDGNGYSQAAACIYVLCPGQPVAWFTFGEKVALGSSAALFFVLSTLFCYVTRQRRRAKRKTDMSPGQQHEIELML
ncbi:hypothetical protein KSF78_0001584 [Schistosoma japonicum]|nr:hypothetical protein KSF78_0001584 [Schistosoma japonicum]